MSQYPNMPSLELLNQSQSYAANSMDAGPAYAPQVMPVYDNENGQKQKEEKVSQA